MDKQQDVNVWVVYEAKSRGEWNIWGIISLSYQFSKILQNNSNAKH